MGATSEAAKVASVITEGADTKATLARLGSGGAIRLEPSPEAGMGSTVSRSAAVTSSSMEAEARARGMSGRSPSSGGISMGSTSHQGETAMVVSQLGSSTVTSVVIDVGMGPD